MKKNRVIEFEPRERIFEKAKKYIESLELFSEETDEAIPLLLKAMKHADRDLIPERQRQPDSRIGIKETG